MLAQVRVSLIANSALQEKQGQTAQWRLSWESEILDYLVCGTGLATHLLNVCTEHQAPLPSVKFGF